MLATKIVLCVKDFLSVENFKILLEKIPTIEIVGEFDNVDVMLKKLIVLKPDIVIFDLQSNKPNDIMNLQKIVSENSKIKLITTGTYEDSRTIAISFSSGVIAYVAKRDMSVCNLSKAIKFTIENKHYVSSCCENMFENISKKIRINMFLN
jgi:DNA-binding NarL/FixJ family response regulator